MDMVTFIMKYKKLSLSIISFLLLIPIANTTAFSYIDNIKDGNYVFFLVDLEIGDNFEVNITHEESGNFTLFLFNRRPTESYVNNDKSLNNKIFNNPPVIAYSLDDNPHINYNITEPRIYYIEIILLDDGPDTFTLSSKISPNDKELTRYYLPIISGFELDSLIIFLVSTVTIIVVLYKKRISK
jgi:hypothetical protein